MRTLLALTLFASACAANDPASTGPDYDSVRDRMSESTARLYIGSEGSSGVLTASRYTNSGWVEGKTPIVISNGELFAHADGSGKLKLETFDVELAPIDIPEEVFGKPAQLQDVKVELASTVSATTQWSSDDEAHATFTLMLDFTWAIAINGGHTQLGTQHLPPIPVDVTFSGSGDHVDAKVSLSASGELWDWAGLLKLTGLEMSLSAETTD